MVQKLGKRLVEANHCEQCGHDWIPRIEYRSPTCPKCGSFGWDRPKKQLIASRTDTLLTK